MTRKSPFGSGFFGPIEPAAGPLATAYTMPPFSVLNARDAAWQERKRAWINIGITSASGRDEALTYAGHVLFYDFYRVKSGKRKTTDGAGTSIFDPVLCELIYRWFCPAGGTVLDPFAGGSVRGIVAGYLGFKYHGIDISEKQVEENRKQAGKMKLEQEPRWKVMNAMDIGPLTPRADLIFTCPPYGDLEVYSEDPQDLSFIASHDYEDFLYGYSRCITQACHRLKDNRFACFVVGDFRNDAGYYRDFIGDTIKAFKKAGLELYNQAVLITMVGTLPIRVSAHFQKNRKLGLAHQNVLVFCKGDWRKAVEELQ